MNTKPAPEGPTRAGDTDPVAALTARLEAKGLEVVPAADLPRPARLVEDGREAAARRDVRLAHYRERWAKRLPAMYAAADLADLDTDAAGNTPADARKVTTWLAAEGSRTLVLAGDVGTGKTHAAYAIGNAAVARGIWTEAWTVTDLLEALRPGGDTAGASDARRCRLLILDDLGQGNATEWAKDALTALIDTRTRENLRQIITTNHPYPALVELWGARLMDRLAFRWTVVTLTGPSRRQGW